MVKMSDVLTEENRFLVLEDNSTYGMDISDSHMVWLTEEGREEFVERDNLHKLEDGMVRWCVSVNHILDCWMEKYGSQEWKGDKKIL